jgi:hypothetical protein
LAPLSIVSSRVTGDIVGEGLLIWLGIVGVVGATEHVVHWGARHFWKLLSGGIG